MARAHSLPIGPALLDSRPLVYLPDELRRVLTPIASLLGRIEAVLGFTEQRCSEAPQCCWRIAAPRPSYVLNGVREFSFQNSLVFPQPVQWQADIELSVRIVAIGHLIEGMVERIHVEDGNCPEKCKSDYCKGVFAAQVEISLKMGATLSDKWNEQVSGDALYWLLFPVPDILGSFAQPVRDLLADEATKILDQFLAAADREYSFSTVVRLDDFCLKPP